jgi:hypothetical protein
MLRIHGDEGNFCCLKLLIGMEIGRIHIRLEWYDDYRFGHYFLLFFWTEKDLTLDGFTRVVQCLGRFL